MNRPSQKRLNPYVGPRAFQYGETLYGRDQEVMDLLDLLIAERIVMLYSPSGAGKSSLIQAALIPELEKEGFNILPVVRISHEPPPDIPIPETFNRFFFSLLLSLEETVAPQKQISLEDLAALDLDGYLKQSDRGQEDSTVIIFDQFEEILTIDPASETEKKEFFIQLGKGLRKSHLWGLFALREDYIAGLDPFVRHIPTRLNTNTRE